MKLYCFFVRFHTKEDSLKKEFLGQLAKYIDITKTIHPKMDVFPGDPSVKLTTYRSQTGNYHKGSVISEIVLTTHTGTHIDAPSHLFDGADTISSFPLKLMTGKAIIQDANADLDNVIKNLSQSEACLLIFKKMPAILEFPDLSPQDFVSIENCGINIVGTDYISVDKVAGKDLPNHRGFLKSGIWILENLYLDNVENGEYKYIMLPLKTSAGDGAPVRAILIKE